MHPPDEDGNETRNVCTVPTLTDYNLAIYKSFALFYHGVYMLNLEAACCLNDIKRPVVLVRLRWSTC